MALIVGDKAEIFQLKSITSSDFSFSSIKAKRCLLSFYRFAACPFCNLRIHELIKRYNELDDRFVIIAIFDSSLPNLQNHALKHNAPFPILADENGTVYKQYGIKHSMAGMLKGMIGRTIKMPVITCHLKKWLLRRICG